jgi:hypothetical protein
MALYENARRKPRTWRTELEDHGHTAGQAEPDDVGQVSLMEQDLRGRSPTEPKPTPCRDEGRGRQLARWFTDVMTESKAGRCRTRERRGIGCYSFRP